MSFKLILIETEADTYGDEYCDCDVTINTSEITLGELADTKQYELKRELVAAFKKLVEAKDDQTIEALKQAGWVNKDGIKDRQEKLVVAQKFLYSDARSGYRTVNEFDLDTMSESTARTLADDRIMVAQSITKTSFKKLMTVEQRKVYDRELKQLKAEKKKRAASLKKRQETAKAKKIAAAKKLLEEAGE